MKTSFRLLAVIFILSFATFVRAGDFKSQFISAFTSLAAIHVHGDQVMVIRNFTQEDTSLLFPNVGVVTVTKPPNGGTSVNVLVAAVVADVTPPDIINSVVIAGPADVVVTCGDFNCFISYRINSNSN